MHETDLPSTQEWSELGFHDLDEIAEGKQSRVFAARSGDGRVVIKLTDAALADATLSLRRMSLMADLADTGLLLRSQY